MILEGLVEINQAKKMQKGALRRGKNMANVHRCESMDYWRICPSFRMAASSDKGCGMKP